MKQERESRSPTFLAKAMVKRGGAGGRGTWGSAKDDIKFLNDDFAALDRNDPNFTGTDDEEDVDFGVFDPNASPEASLQFTQALETVSQFKESVKVAVRAFFVSYECEDFERKLVNLNAREFHHEVGKIVISLSLDRSQSDRKQAATLLLYLYEREVLTRSQLEFSFRRLYSRLSDLMLDVPRAVNYLNEFRIKATVGGWIDPALSDILEQSADIVAHPEQAAALKRSITSMIDEYFVSEDLHDTARAITELQAPACHHQVVKEAISRAMDRTPREREMASRLIGQLAGDPLSMCEVQKGFELLLDRVDDMHNDVPDLLNFLSCFIARAIVDDALEPAFLNRVDLTEADTAMQVVSHARSLINMKHAAARLSRVWGGEQLESVTALKNRITQLIEEYFSSGDIEEASRCITELSAPYFLHELVKQLFCITADKHERELDLTSDLLAAAAKSDLISRGQLIKGFDRLCSAIEDISVDAPQAKDMLVRLLRTCIQAGFLPERYKLNLNEE